jgi:hypothetical protein
MMQPPNTASPRAKHQPHQLRLCSAKKVNVTNDQDHQQNRGRRSIRLRQDDKTRQEHYWTDERFEKFGLR